MADGQAPTVHTAHVEVTADEERLVSATCDTLKDETDRSPAVFVRGCVWKDLEKFVELLCRELMVVAEFAEDRPLMFGKDHPKVTIELAPCVRNQNSATYAGPEMREEAAEEFCKRTAVGLGLCPVSAFVEYLPCGRSSGSSSRAVREKRSTV